MTCVRHSLTFIVCRDALMILVKLPSHTQYFLVFILWPNMRKDCLDMKKIFLDKKN